MQSNINGLLNDLDQYFETMQRYMFNLTFLNQIQRNYNIIYQVILQLTSQQTYLQRLEIYMMGIKFRIKLLMEDMAQSSMQKIKIRKKLLLSNKISLFQIFAKTKIFLLKYLEL
ncbi:UNKNOWN [Stylonychia lemnae]|uniref:Uncharacterized protein n=1 Tax=Stylonychia lemnae TaxID=5949 RepID=A0A077ZXJ1_STYLE|nr:UNKNOWN [Stylonychia lemnae]|eukprot:CDW74626.1 UNKNOWN [Stylonychia lemnae]